jgi:hypothetical protein
LFLNYYYFDLLVLYTSITSNINDTLTKRNKLSSVLRKLSSLANTTNTKHKTLLTTSRVNSFNIHPFINPKRTKEDVSTFVSKPLSNNYC